MEEDLKSILRSVLGSNPRKTRMSSLKRDFKELYGKEFPFRSLGYKSFFEYLQSIPDTLLLVDTGDPDPTVLPVVSNKSVHVESLVMRQKVDTKKSGRSGRAPPPRRPPAIPYQYFHKVPPLMSLSPFIKPDFNERKPPQSYTNHTNSKRPCATPKLETYTTRNNNYGYGASYSECTSVPKIVCQELKRLMNMKTSGITLCELAQAIIMKEKYKYALAEVGISNVKDLLDNCRDFVTVNGNLVFPKSGERFRGGAQTFYPDCSEEYLDTENDFDSSKMEFLDDFDDKTVHNQEENNRTTTIDKACSSTDDEDLVGDRVVSNFKMLLNIYPEGILCAQLPNFYYKEFRVPLDFREWGYSSIIQMASRLPNVFHYVREGSCSDFKLFDVRYKYEDRFSSNNGTKEKSNLLEQKWIPQSVVENTKKILAQHPTGLPSTKFLEKYEKEYNNKLNLSELGFDTFQAFLDAIKDVVHLREGYKKLYLLPKNIKKKEELPRPLVPALPEIQNLIPQLYPKEVCGKDCVLELLDLNTILEHNIKDDHMIITIRVTEVSNPGCFWMVLEENWSDLTDMMTDLNDFYNQHTEEDDRYLMPDSTLYPGQLCVAPYGIENTWHRVRIVHLFPIEDEVKIEYVDYGTISKVKKSMLRFLHKDFAELPQQSIKGKLFGIKPIAPKWSKESGLQLLDLVNDRSYFAEVVRCKPKDVFLEIILYQPGSSTKFSDFIINSYFVEIGVAQYSKHKEGNENEKEMSSSSSSPIQNGTIQSPQLIDIDSPKESERYYRIENSSPDMQSNSNLQLQSTSQVNETHECMLPPRGPPPGFTKKDITFCNSYPAIMPSMNINRMDSFAENGTQNVVVESFNRGLQIGQHMQSSSLSYGTSMPLNNLHNQLYPYQITINPPYQFPDPYVLQAFSSLWESQRFNVPDINVTRPSVPDLKQSQSLPPIIHTAPLQDFPKSPVMSELPQTPESISSISISPDLTLNSVCPSLISPKLDLQEFRHLHETLGINNHNESFKDELRDMASQYEEQSYAIKEQFPAGQTLNGNNHSNMTKVRGIWSPVEIDNNLIEKNRLKFEVKNFGYRIPKNSVTSSDKVSCDSSKVSSPKSALVSDHGRKTPDNWEDILVEAYDEKLKFYGSLSKTLSPSESGKNLQSIKSICTVQPINDVKMNSNKNNNGDDVLVIPPIINKTSSPINEVITSLRNIKVVDKPVKPQCLLKVIEIGVQTLHIMKINGKVMVSFEEITRKFTSFSGHHVITKILDAKRITLPFLDVFRDKNQKLFEEIDRTELFDLNKKTGTSFRKMNVLPLKVVPQLLSALNINNSKVISDFKKAINEFKDDEDWG